MTTRVVRKIVKIDEEKCNGCGECIPNCVEGALRIVNGKAKLISDKYCDGLGACLGKCPQDAITVEERVADEFSEEAVHQLHSQQVKKPVKDVPPCACPSTAMSQFSKERSATSHQTVHIESTLSHWPVQLTLVPPGAPFLKNADLLVTADCVPIAYANYHRDFLKDHAVVIACPKLDDYEAHLSKLTEIMSHSDVKSLTVLHMEVPCCFGLVNMAKQALEASGKDIPFKEITIGVRGNRKS